MKNTVITKRKKPDTTEQWKVHIIEQFKKIHQDAISFQVRFFWENKTIQEWPLEEIELYADNLFNLTLSNPELHPFAGAEELLLTEKNNEIPLRHIERCGMSAYKSVYLTRNFLKLFDREKDKVTFKQSTEHQILALTKMTYYCIGYRLGIEDEAIEAEAIARENNPGGNKRAEMAETNLSQVKKLLEDYDKATSPFRRGEIRNKIKTAVRANTDRTFYNYRKRFKEL